MSRRELLLGLPVAAAGLLVCGLSPARERSRSDLFTNYPFKAGEFGYHCFRTPGLAVTASGVVLAFCGGRLITCKDDGDHDVVLRRSLDGGQTWEHIQVIANDQRNRCDIPVPVVLSSGRILLLWVWNEYATRKQQRGKRHVMVCHSDDQGLTWSAPRDITKQVRRPGWNEWYGIGPGHGFVMQHGRSPGRIVVPARHGEPGIGSRSHLILSDDDGINWYLGSQAKGPHPSNEATACELGNGIIMMNSRGSIGYRIITLIKEGGLVTDQTFVDYSLIEPKNGCQGSLLTYNIDASSKRATLLFSNPSNPFSRTDGRLRVSVNNGESWSKGYDYTIERNGFCGYSDLARFSNGDIGILFESGATENGLSKKSDRYNLIAFKRLRPPME